ncbi:MAG TPA: PepSY-associated TM helix domain-containing protein [Chryseosolibacter sp.]
MNKNNTRVVLLRKLRSAHKYIGVLLAAFFIVTGLTGVLLGWKKNVETLQPRTFNGASDNLAGWKSFSQIAEASIAALDTVIKNPSIDRMDVRPDKGIVKVLFTEGYWEVQVDGTTGKILSVAQRHSDWIEHLHDGSLISDAFKLAYTNLLGIGIVILALSGLWLWYGPKVIRRSKENTSLGE